MNSYTFEILSNNGVKILDEECCVCYENFIDIDTFDLLHLYEKLGSENKIPKKLSQEIISTCASNTLSYNDRFECVTCNNSKVCHGCISKSIDETDEEMDNWNGKKDTMEYTRVITCPICKTTDYRLKIIGDSVMGSGCGVRGGNLPEDLLRSIKGINKK
jgi:hypothetical protein